MDYLNLQMKIKKDPQNYSKEYFKALNIYQSMLKLPKIPQKESRSIVNFLTNTTKYYLNTNNNVENNYKFLLFTHLDLAKEKKESLINNVFSLKNQGIVTLYEYFNIILKHCQKFKPISSKCEEELLRLKKNSNKKKAKKSSKKYKIDKTINDKTINDKSINDKSINDKTINDKTINDKIINDKSINDKSINDKTINDKTINDKTINDKTINDKTINDKSINDKSINDKSINDKTINDKIINDKTINDKTINDKTINDKIINDKNHYINDENNLINDESQNTDTINNIASLFYKYLKIGNERQRLFSIHMLIFLYEENLIDLKELLIDNLFSNDKVGKFILFYFLKNINDDGEFVNKDGEVIKIKIEKRNNESNNIDNNNDYINKNDYINVNDDYIDDDFINNNDDYINNNDYNNEDNQKLRNNFNNDDENSSDSVQLSELLKILPRIYSDITKKEADDLSKKLFSEVQQKLDERPMRLKKLKIISLIKQIHKLNLKLNNYLLRLIDPSRGDLKFVINILLESMTNDDVKSVVARVVDMFCSEYRDDDFIVYGLNILKEIVLRFKVDVSDKIKIFRHSKVKSIFYAYSMVMRAVKYGTCDKRDVDFIKMRYRKVKKDVDL
ncbi:hypothetical protein DMUE_4754 [Dictyocoela muelleri]|nr:hypothetical protein DMUE_4754 [Dictyocoela muelleri]